VVGSGHGLFDVLFCRLTVGTKENHECPQSGQTVSSFEPKTPSYEGDEAGLPATRIITLVFILSYIINWSLFILILRKLVFISAHNHPFPHYIHFCILLSRSYTPCTSSVICYLTCKFIWVLEYLLAQN
jgi:hypothetical protein